MDWRAKRVTIPALQAGDRLRYEVETRRSASLVPNHFWVDFGFTTDAVVLTETLEIDVPASRAVRTSARLGEEQPPVVAGGRRVLRWTHSQPEPVAAPEDRDALIAALEESKQGPHVRLSSFTDWRELGVWFDGVVASRSEPDAAVRAKALELTRGLETPGERLRALFDFVSTRIRYVSLAFGMGRLEPRPAGQVLSTEYGDCKDKHTLLAGLARAVGLDVRPVLISSHVLLDERVPSPSQFDHVVSLHAPSGSDERVWMDTTSGVLPPGALLAMHRDRKALLVSADAARPAGTTAVVMTPADLPTANRVTIDIEGAFEAPGTLTARVRRRVVGEAEYLLRLALRDLSQQDRIEIAKAEAATDGLKGATVTSFDFKDAGPGREVEYSYETSQTFTLPAGKPWPIWLPAPSLALPDAPESQPLELGLPMEFVLTAKYEVPEGVRAKPPIPVTIEREFASYASTYRIDGRRLIAERRLRTLARKLEPAQFDAYRAFRRAVDADYRQRFMAEPLTLPDAAAGTPDELNAAGHRAVEAGDYARAIDLLTRATAADPKHKYAWNNLGRAYMMTRKYDAALDAFKTQIAINPYDEYAYANMGRTLRLQGKPAEAVAQLEKQIEVSPLDQFAHAELGRVHLELERPKEAAAWLEKAVSLSAKDASLWVDLGRARLGAGEASTAMEAFDRAVELAPNPNTWNNVAWALAEKGVNLETAEARVRSAIDATAALLRNVTLDTLRTEHLQAAGALAAYWDTLGWIHFQRGALAEAETWIRAAWELIQVGEVAEHLAEILEGQEKRDEAIDLYAYAATADGGRPSSRAALQRLVGASKVDAAIDASLRRIAANEAMPLPRLLDESARADVHLLVEGSRVADIRASGGDEALRDAVRKLIGVRLPFTSPGAQVVRIARQGIVQCAENTGCTLRLLSPAIARIDGR